MKKMLKIMAMLLVIGAVVFAAGCASKNSGSDTNQEAAQEVTNQGAIAEDNGTNNSTVAANVSENVSGNNSTVVGNVSGNNSTVVDNVSGNNS
jgi:hypothetical protein